MFLKIHSILKICLIYLKVKNVLNEKMVKTTIVHGKSVTVVIKKVSPEKNEKK